MCLRFYKTRIAILKSDTQDRNWILQIYAFNVYSVEDMELINKIFIHPERSGFLNCYITEFVFAYYDLLLGKSILFMEV